MSKLTPAQTHALEQARILYDRGGPFTPAEQKVLPLAEGALNGSPPRDGFEIWLRKVGRTFRVIEPKATRQMDTPYDRALEEDSAREESARHSEAQARNAAFDAAARFEKFTAATWVSDGYTQYKAPTDKHATPEKLKAAREEAESAERSWREARALHENALIRRNATATKRQNWLRAEMAERAAAGRE